MAKELYGEAKLEYEEGQHAKCAARKSATANPFIINDFYDLIEGIIKEKKLTAAQIWNCDESVFPTDPSKSKVISPRGEVAYKITWGAGRENISTLAACSASGRALDPLIIFSGKNFQSTWKGETPLPNTMYGISDNGWMTTQIFLEWFTKFTEEVTERPLLLIYDGHLSHVSIELIEKAMAENITIVKLPPHVTDKLQPLDVCCFGPLKREWEHFLCNRVNVLGPKETISKGTFVDLLSSVWHKGLSPENAIAGFTATGIYPVDRTKYPKERFDARLVKRYDQWVALGKPDDIMEDLAVSLNTPKKLKPAPELEIQQDSPVIADITIPSLSATPPGSTSTPLLPQQHKTCQCKICAQIGPQPPPVPGKTWVPAWALQTPTVPATNKSFQELVLDKMKGPQEKVQVKRRKIDRTAKIITRAEYADDLKEKVNNELEKKNRTKAKKNPKKGNKKIDFDVGESDESEDDVVSMKDDSEDEDNDEDSEEERLLKLWKSIGPPAAEADVGIGTVMESVPVHLDADVDFFPIYNIIDGPLVVETMKAGKWNVPDYANLKKKFEEWAVIDTKELSKKL